MSFVESIVDRSGWMKSGDRKFRHSPWLVNTCVITSQTDWHKSLLNDQKSEPILMTDGNRLNWTSGTARLDLRLSQQFHISGRSAGCEMWKRNGFVLTVCPARSFRAPAAYGQDFAACVWWSKIIVRIICFSTILTVCANGHWLGNGSVSIHLSLLS